MPPITPPVEPPGTPPTTPPVTPVLGGGVSSSWIILTCFGIFVGARKAPSTISLTLCTCSIFGAAGGVGGGGGGGATSQVVSWLVGRASVKINVGKTREPTHPLRIIVEIN